MHRHLTFGVVSSVVRCGHEYGVFPSVDLAENWHVALGRRPIVGARETQEVHTREVRVFQPHLSLFHRKSSHLRWLAHARSRSPVLPLPRCWHWSGGNSGRCWPSHAAAQVAARKGHSRVRHFDGVFGCLVAAHGKTFVCALRWSWPGDPSTWVRVRRHPSALSSPLLCIIQSAVDTHAASISFKWAALMRICILVTVSACLFVCSCTIGSWVGLSALMFAS